MILFYNLHSSDYEELKQLQGISLHGACVCNNAHILVEGSIDFCALLKLQLMSRELARRVHNTTIASMVQTTSLGEWVLMYLYYKVTYVFKVDPRSSPIKYVFK